MVNEKCKNCSKFITNDCQGLSLLNKEACQNMLKNKEQEVDVSGCCWQDSLLVGQWASGRENFNYQKEHIVKKNQA